MHSMLKVESGVPRFVLMGDCDLAGVVGVDRALGHEVLGSIGVARVEIPVVTSPTMRSRRPNTRCRTASPCM